MTATKRRLKDSDRAGMHDDSTPIFDVVIVGGGLSGLMVARYLNSSNSIVSNDEDGGGKITWKLFEASSRIGGRLQNDVSSDGRSMNIDLGGAWVWPRHQPTIMRALVNSQTLGIRTFLQPGEDYRSSETTRIVGGAVEFVNKIYDELLVETNDVQLECPIVAVRKNPDRTISVELQSGKLFNCLYVVLAVPPRILSKNVSFYPKLPEAKSAAMSESETWMAGVTKVALVYKGSPSFWPLIISEGDNILSPRKRRPAFQVYDGSPFSSLSSSINKDGDEGKCNDKISVLTFFTSANLSNNNKDDMVLANDCAEQMCDSLSAEAIRKVPVLDKYIKSFDEFYVKRWPHEPYISHDTDPIDITPHPAPIPELAKSEWDGTLHFASTETDQCSPGVMEGAVGAAIRVAGELAQYL